jgi:uncharacterized phage protein gp47/JayE
MPTTNTKTREEIVSRILNALEQNADITATSPGSIARAFAEAFGTEMFYLYESFREAVNQTSLSTASGRGLDLIGELYNVRRKTIDDQLTYERNTANIEFILATPSASDIVIPKGTLVYNDVGSFSSAQYSYKVHQDIVVLAGSTKSYGIVQPNFESNDYVASVGTLTRHNYISPPGVLVFCNNPKEVYPVVNSESDNNFRRRILSAIKTNTTGTTEAIRFAALSVSGVRDIRIREASFGLGSCEIIIVPEIPGKVGNTATLVGGIVDSVRPVGIKMNIYMADPVEYGINATITLPYGTADNLRRGIENQATVFVKRYLNSLTIGDTVSIQEIERQIRISSDLIRTVNITSATASGVNVNRKDFRLTGERQYVVSGNIGISSVIIGLSNY